MTEWYTRASQPQFDRPPVFEIAMGIEFVPIFGLDAYRLNVLQGKWRAQYPNIENVPGVPPSELMAVVPAAFQITQGQPPARVWARSADGSRLVQTQSDRLILNWQSRGTDAPYPGFDELRMEYELLWHSFLAFLQEEGLEGPQPRLGEFTYVNSVKFADGESLPDVVTVVRAPEGVPGVETIARFQFARQIDKSAEHPFSAQVVVTGEPQASGPDREIVLQVSTRTIFTEPVADPLRAIDAAHGLSSFTFAGIVSPAKQDSWGLKS